jgi:rhamnosyltransferase
VDFTILTFACPSQPPGNANVKINPLGNSFKVMDHDIINMKNGADQSGENDAQPAVAVMLATYNGERYVREQIDSILNQVGVRATIYVRDDHSTDDTKTILDKYSNSYPGQVLLLTDSSRRFGAACENFLSILVELYNAPHDYFAFADQDDIWLPEKLSRAVRQLKAANASGYASNLTAFSASPASEWLIHKAYSQARFDHLFQSASAGCTYVFDADAAGLIASRVGQIASHDWTGMSHDWLCYAICRSHGLSWIIDDWSGIRYRQHGQNQFGAMPGVKGAMKRLSLMRQGWYRDVLLRNRHFLNPENQEEQLILDRLVRLDISDRLWLAAHVRKFRREPKAQLGLAGALVTGLF